MIYYTTWKWKQWPICRNMHEEIGFATLSALKGANNYIKYGHWSDSFYKKTKASNLDPS